MTAFSRVPSLPPELAREVQRVLTAGETVLWSAQPARRRLLQRDGITFACGLFFLLISLLFLAANHAAGLPALLIAAPFLAAGLWMTIKPLKNASVAARTVYLITDQQVMTLTDGFARRLLPAETQARLVKRRADGSGDLFFTAWDKSLTTADGASLQRNGFLGIPDIQAVDDLLRQTFGGEAGKHPIRGEQPQTSEKKNSES